MATFGVFTDAVYNVANELPVAQYKTSTQNGGTLAAANLAGATECYVAMSGQTTAQAITLDTAANILSVIESATPSAVPNGMTYIVTIVNSNTVSGAITLSAGAGITLVAGAAIAINTAVEFLVTINSVSTANPLITFQRIASKTV